MIEYDKQIIDELGVNRRATKRLRGKVRQDSMDIGFGKVLFVRPLKQLATSLDKLAGVDGPFCFDPVDPNCRNGLASLDPARRGRSQIPSTEMSELDLVSHLGAGPELDGLRFRNGASEVIKDPLTAFLGKP